MVKTKLRNKERRKDINHCILRKERKKKKHLYVPFQENAMNE